LTPYPSYGVGPTLTEGVPGGLYNPHVPLNPNPVPFYPQPVDAMGGGGYPSTKPTKKQKPAHNPNTNPFKNVFKESGVKLSKESFKNLTKEETYQRLSEKKH